MTRTTFGRGPYLFMVVGALFLTSTETQAAPRVTPNLCKQMVDRWGRSSWTDDQINGCAEWRKDHSTELWAKLELCKDRTHDAEGACDQEMYSYTGFISAAAMVEPSPFTYTAHGLLMPPAPKGPTDAERIAAEERRDAARRAARKKAIIEEFANGDVIPAAKGH